MGFKCGANTTKGHPCKNPVRKEGKLCKNHKIQDAKPRCKTLTKLKKKCRNVVTEEGLLCKIHNGSRKEGSKCGAPSKKGFCTHIVAVQGDRCRYHSFTDEKPTQKRCFDCRVLRNFNDFFKDPKGRHELKSKCKNCLRKSGKEVNHPPVMLGTKRCYTCSVVMSVLKFCINKQLVSGRASSCRNCTLSNEADSISTLEKFVHLLFKSTERKIKKTKLEISITEELIIIRYHNQNGLCARTKKKMTYFKTYDPNRKTRMTDVNQYNLSIDRIDSSKGYIEDNIQLVCAGYNFMKLDIEQSVVTKICKDITEYQSFTNEVKDLDEIDPMMKIFLRKCFNSMIQSVKHRSKKIEVFITFDDIEKLYKRTGGISILSGKRLTRVIMSSRNKYRSISKEEKGPLIRKEVHNNPSIDRIDSSGDYSIGNIQMITLIENLMKGEMSQEMFLDFCKSASKCDQEN
uniref:Zn-finger protein n=1 Tax=Pithovirus LCPAC403 TaxID=2506596 RepID=A0A481ZAH0_9VIRU|nr:MAG: uncharacterized protein LCPAC403_00420 [Pithovirus LCPAC403]